MKMLEDMTSLLSLKVKYVLDMVVFRIENWVDLDTKEEQMETTLFDLGIIDGTPIIVSEL